VLNDSIWIVRSTDSVYEPYRVDVLLRCEFRTGFRKLTHRLWLICEDRLDIAAEAHARIEVDGIDRINRLTQVENDRIERDLVHSLRPDSAISTVRLASTAGFRIDISPQSLSHSGSAE
jgi:hypothetical protein